MSDIAERLKTCEGVGACLSGDPRFAQDTMREGAAEIERLRSVMREISRQYENQNLNHVDFRVAAKQAADAALSSANQQDAT